MRRRSRLLGLGFGGACVACRGRGRGGRRLAGVGGGIWLLGRGLGCVRAWLNGKGGEGRGMRCTVREEEDGDGFGFFKRICWSWYMNSMYAQPDGSTYPPPVAVSLRYTYMEKS